MDLNQATQIKYEVSHALHGSLELDETLTSFYRAVREQRLCEGMHYAMASRELDLRCGNRGPRSTHHALKLKSQRLGTLTFYREKPFSEADLARLEELLEVLLLPLRNALLYRDAVQNSLRDSLTGVGNRAAFELAFKREQQLARRTGANPSLLMIDIDHFKRINDRAGHRIGDLVLRQTAKTVAKCLRQTDQLFRYGGEEFTALLSNTTTTEAMAIAERVRMAVMRQATNEEGHTYSLTVSVGVSRLRDNDDRDDLFQRADQALYTAKSQGRNCVVSAEQTLVPLMAEVPK